MRFTRASLLANACALSFASAQDAQPVLTPPKADFTIVATDYKLALPSQVDGGWRTIRFHNTGSQFHHVIFLRVQDERAAASTLASLSTWREDVDRPIPGAIAIGGTENAFTTKPIADTYAIIDLRPGLYLVICSIPSDSGLHVNRGMHALLRVNARAKANPTPRPIADLTVRESNYSYRMSTASLNAGWRLIEVLNDGPSEHVAGIARLKEGKHAADVIVSASANLPAEQDPLEGVVGGATRLAKGQRTFVWVQLKPGNYVVGCPLNDANHKAHELLGMISEFSVR